MRTLALLLVSSALLTACGGSSGGSGSAAEVDYNQLRNSAPDDSGLRQAANAAEFEGYVKNGLRLLVRDNDPSKSYPLIVNPALIDETTLDLSGTEGSDFSSTNVQVNGVDESDVSKYDGSFLYIYQEARYIETTGGFEVGKLRVVETDPVSASSQLRSELPLEDTDRRQINGLYLNGDNVAVLTTLGLFPSVDDFGGASEEPFFFRYAYDTRLDLVDVADRSTPAVSWSLEFDGELHSSRKVGNILYLVTHYYPRLPELLLPADTEELRAANEARINDAPIEELLPQYRINGQDQGALVTSLDCLVPGDMTEYEGLLNIVTVVAVDLSQQSIVNSLCMSTPIDGLYSSQQNIYLGASLHDNDFIFTEPAVTVQASAEFPEEYTTFHKIALNGGQVEYRASGEAPGRLGWSNVQFRMDEYQGDLRVITSLRNNWQPVHQLTILREENDELVTVSTLPNDDAPEPIGKPGEDIYAVRFFEDIAYIVTFERIDPLYKLDLSNPQAPRIAGELEVPGFSSYLHPINDSWLLSVGYEVKDQRNGGVKVELFDVSNEDPRSAGQAIIGRRGSGTEALFDHRAMGFLTSADGDRLQMTLPVNMSDTPSSWEGYYEWTHTGLYLFDVDGLSGSNAQLSQEGVIIGSQRNEEQQRPSSYNANRGYLHDDAVFFVYDDRVLSAFWDDPLAIAQEQSTDGPLDFEQRKLRENRFLWSQQARENYQFNIRQSCFCLPETTREKSVFVMGGLISGAVYVDSSEDLNEGQLSELMTINELFEYIGSKISEKPFILSVDYDDETGYPTEIHIDQIEGAVDDEVSFFISEVM